jgi:hypothetical protein
MDFGSDEARHWAAQFDRAAATATLALPRAFDACDRAEWLFYLAGAMRVPQATLVRAACTCARSALASAGIERWVGGRELDHALAWCDAASPATRAADCAADYESLRARIDRLPWPGAQPNLKEAEDVARTQYAMLATAYAVRGALYARDPRVLELDSVADAFNPTPYHRAYGSLSVEAMRAVWSPAQAGYHASVYADSDWHQQVGAVKRLLAAT